MVPDDDRVPSNAWVNHYKYFIDAVMISAKNTSLGKVLAKGESPFLQQTLHVIESIGNILESSEETPESKSNFSLALKLDIHADKLSAAINLRSKRSSKSLIISRQDNVKKAQSMLNLLKEDRE